MTDEILIEDTEDGKPPRSWDFFLTVLLLFVLLVLAAIFLVLGFGLGVTTLTCADSNEECNYDVISLGSLIVFIGVPVVTLAGIITSVVFIARRKLSFLVALVSVLALVGVFVLGSWLVSLAVPSS